MTTTSIILDLYSRNLADTGVHTITLTSTLKSYNPYTGSIAPTVSKTFTLTAVDPCLSTAITTEPTQIEDLVGFAGFNVTSLQMYSFNDTISIANTLATDSVDFCG